MKTKDISKLWFLYLACCAVLTFCVGYACSRAARPEPEPKLAIEVLIEFQTMVGARPDGEIGPETTEKGNAQCEIDKPTYFNRQAAPFFTESGGKE